MDIRAILFKNKASMFFSKREILPIFYSIVLFLTSCASVSVKKVERLTTNPPAKIPSKILVAPFTFTDAGLRADRNGAALEAFKFDLQERTTRNLIRRLPKYVGPATAIAATAPLPRGNYWLLTGNFDQVNQGSRFLRAIVGFGAGGTKMNTTVIVYDLSHSTKKPFLKIETTGGSNISMGVGGVLTFFVSGPIALTSLFNVVDGVRSGVTFDAIRTSREINAALSEYLYQQGAISYEKAAGPKRSGKLPNRFSPPDRSKLRGFLTIKPADTMQ